MTFHWVADHSGMVHAKAWKPWLRRTAKFSKLWSEQLDGDDPFAYNETASVSVLASTAVASGYLALAEYGLFKLDASDRRRSHPRICRADLFVSQPDGPSWAFEFKQLLPKRVPDSNCVADALEAAESDARRIPHTECSQKVAGVVVSTWWLEDASERHETEALLLRNMKQKQTCIASFGTERSTVFVYLRRL